MGKNGNGDRELQTIEVLGAREHNLKNVNVSIPRDKLVVITGLSGSGKSSLAFDTLYAEGQRRYVECLSAYARQFLGMLKKPDVDTIDGLSPAISIDQKSIGNNPRSTVGTVTEIYDYLRLLYAKIGVQHCLECKVPVVQKSLDQIVDEIFEQFDGKKIQILTPLIKGRKGHYKELFQQLMKQGFTRVRIDGEMQFLQEDLQVSRYKIHDIELIIDRCIVEKDQLHRISESTDLALKKGDGTMMLLFESDNGKLEYDERLYSTSYACPSCSKAYEPLAPNMFSFNSPYGACPYCEGLGEFMDFDMSLVIPDDSISIERGGLAPIGKKRDTWLWNQVAAFAKHNEIDLTVPISKMNQQDLDRILVGAKQSTVNISYKFSGGKEVVYKHKFIGILPSLKHHYSNTSSGARRKSYENFMASQICPVCKGGRLKEENLSVFIADSNIHNVAHLDISSCFDFFNSIDQKLTARELKIAGVIIKEIRSRLKFLTNVGLAYLSIERSVRTLSGGESQRIRLASQIGSELVGILYVLDEPSIGLHQHDNNKLIKSLKDLRDLGNTVIVVEHDKAMIENSDYFFDMGPGAGRFGGEVVFASTPANLKKNANGRINKSLTAQYLLSKKEIAVPKERREGNGNTLVLNGATGNNLQNVTLNLPLGKIICITGMSGSGKSSLINDTLYPIISRKFYRSTTKPLPYKSIEGLEHIDKVIEINQSPIGRTPRSNPATYTGIFTQIRDFYSLLPESKIRGYKPGRFSFNVKGGRCEECQGAGLRKIEMDFLPNVYVTCDVCNGKRYNKETLSVKYKGKSIADVLAMTIEESLEYFAEIPKLKKKLQTIYDVGLSYIKLGQQAPTLSGGEAQRVKLATELSKVSTGKTLYLLDEPTTGLHFEDIRILLKLLDKLVSKGNTVIIIEHNLDVIKYADWIIDLGPEGGSSGGEIIAEGTPEKIMRIKKSYTGMYLKEELKK